MVIIVDVCYVQLRVMEYVQMDFQLILKIVIILRNHILCHVEYILLLLWG